MPVQLDPTLAAMPAIEIDGDVPTVRVLRVAGDVPRGRVFATTGRPGTDQMIALVAPGGGGASALVDRARDRWIGVYRDELTEWSIAPGEEGEITVRAIDGVRQASSFAEGVVTDRALITLSGRRLIAMDPSAEVPAWSALGSAELPVDRGAALAWDPVRRRVLAFDGATDARPPVESSQVVAIDEAGASTVVLETTGDGPPATDRSAAVVIDDALVVIAMVYESGEFVASMHALDLTTSVWRRLAASVPAFSTLVPHGDGHLWVIARDGRGWDLDIARDEARPLAITGTPPPDPARTFWTPAAGGVVAVQTDLAGAHDDAPFYQLVPTEDGACWVSGRSGLHGSTFDVTTRGSFDGATGWFVGPTVWRVRSTR